MTDRYLDLSRQNKRVARVGLAAWIVYMLFLGWLV
jgi:hypothetical protein